MTREICLDTETTGLDPIKGHKIVEIGCVEIINKIKTDNAFHVYINPERDIPESAFKIHGISSDFLKDKPKFSEVIEDFIEFIADSALVIHNAAFDMKFINYELRQCNQEIIERHRVIDSLLMARNKFPGAGNSLDALCKRFHIDSSRRVKHGALLDAELLAEVYTELCGGRQKTMFEASAEKEKQQEDIKAVGINKKTVLASRNFSPNKEDLDAHQEFLVKNFKQNPWKNYTL
ncbi:DNA polymerase III subunit epsilon [Flavobacteriaceae bacterium]|nr:DNA polymerase III subunit epsilon [Flavobacteriaceae bacterium]